MRIFITGGTGLIGRRLVPRLVERGDEMVVLSRSESPRRFGNAEVTFVLGDPTRPGDWQATLATCDAVVNLAGENVADRRWTTESKTRIRDSRTLSTRRVVQAIGQADGQCRTLVSASAIGYYGSRGDAVLDESSGPGNDFLAEVNKAWEAEANRAAEHGVRVVCIRIGVVLDAAGGALAKLLPVFRRFAGGPVGSGRQWFSWIHHADLVGIITRALDDDTITGAVNATAPNPVTNREFSTALGRALRRPAIMRVPGVALRIGMGEAAGMVLASQRVVPRVALEHNHEFQFERIDAALADVLAKD
jgi:uncharacterized protein